MRVHATCLLLLAPLASMQAGAHVVVTADALSLGLRTGDELELQGTRGDGERVPFHFDDPLGFDWAWTQCSALSKCRALVRRGGKAIELPMPIGYAELISSSTEANHFLGELQVDDDAGRESKLADLENWARDGNESLAAWVLMRLAVDTASSPNVDLALAFEAQALSFLTAAEPNLADQVRLNVTVALLQSGNIELVTSRLDQFLGRNVSPLLRVRAARAKGLIALQHSELKEAERLLRDVLPLARRVAPDSHLLASTLNGLGVVVRPQGRLDEARALFEEALRTANDFEDGSETVVMLRSNLGLLERAAGNLVAAEQQLRNALAIAARLLDSQALVWDTQSNLALVLLDRGLTKEATGLWDSIASQGGDLLDAEAAARAQQNLALVYAQQGNYREALRRMRLSVDYWRKSAGESLELATALADHGLYAAHAGEYATAQVALQESQDLQLRFASEGPGQISVLDTLATVSMLSGDLNLALKQQREALARRASTGQHLWRRDYALLQLARIQLALDKPAPAMDALREAESVAIAQGRDGMLAAVLAQQGKTFLALGRSTDAVHSACSGVGHIEALRAMSPSGVELSSSFSTAASPIYQSCMDALAAQGEFGKVIDMYQAERKALLASLLLNRDMQFAGLDAKLAAQRTAARAELRNVLQQVEANSDRGNLSQLKTRRDLARQRLRFIQTKIDASVAPPASWQVSRSLGKGPVHAPAGHLVIAFAVREANLLRITLHPSMAPSVDVLPITESGVRQMVMAWRTAIEQRDTALEPKLAKQVGEALLGDQTLAAGPLRLIFVPDGPLHGIPFSALRTDSGRRLIEAKEVLIAAVLPESVRRNSSDTAVYDLLALADGRGGDQRPPLPFIDEEIAALKELPWRRIEVLRDDAANARALQRMGPGARRIHIAVHGRNDLDSPLDSALFMSDPGGEARPLSAWEIFETLRIDSDLVVLAACETAPGAKIVDDSWLGMTRAFQFAGAKRVMSTLWEVDDFATASLMSSFYDNLVPESLPEAALAEAQRDSLTRRESVDGAVRRGAGGLGTAEESEEADLADPYSWAGFQVYLAPE